jgi:phosphatidylinositol 4-kinase
LNRHNGNILLTNKGHLIHIDFGFVFGTCPGGINFESCPFKLTAEYISILGGLNSDMFVYYRVLMIKGFLELRKHMNTFVGILEPMIGN